MPPRRKQRKDDDDDAPVLTRSVAVSSDLPWLASRYDSSYGSAPSALPRNNLSGQFRNLQDIVQDALVDAESDEERRPRGSKSMSMSNTPTSEPTPKPKPKPKTKQKSALLQPESSSNFGLEISNSSDASASTPEVGRGQNTPRRNPTRTVNTGTLLSNLGWPRVTGTPDSTRTFGQESSLFGGAELRSTPSRSPNPDILPTTEGEESPIEEDSYPARRSPTKRLFPPRGESSMPPRGQTQVGLRGHVGSPNLMVADHPAPALRSNPFVTVNRAQPKTPPKDTLRSQSESSHHPSPARPPSAKQSPAKPVPAEPPVSVGSNVSRGISLSPNRGPPAAQPSPGASRHRQSSVAEAAPVRSFSRQGSMPAGPAASVSRPATVPSNQEYNRAAPSSTSVKPTTTGEVGHIEQHLTDHQHKNPGPGPVNTAGRSDSPSKSTTDSRQPRPSQFDGERDYTADVDRRPTTQSSSVGSLQDRTATSDRGPATPSSSSNNLPGVQRSAWPNNDDKRQSPSRPGSQDYGRRVANGNVPAEPVSRHNVARDSYRNVPDQSFQQNNQANGRPAWNGNVSTEAIPRYNTTHDTYRNVPTHSFQQNGQANEPAANHRANSAQQNGGERPQGHSLFGSLMQDSIDQERRVDRAQQAKLHSERRRRLATHPYVYEIVYKVTKLPRPRSPGRVSDDSDSDGSVAFDMRSRQTPTEELPWGSWLLFRLADAFVAVLDLLFPDTPWYQRPAYIMLAVLVGWLLSRLLSTSDAGSDVLGWLGFSGFNAGLRVPLWMSRPSTIFSDDESREIQRQQRDHDYEITKLTKSSNLHDGSLSKLEGIVPKVVHLKLDKNGRPIIAQEFWHALRDLMKGDREILTIDRGRNGYYHISDEHWRATKDRLSQDPVYQKAASPPQPGTSPADVENIFESKLAKTWEKWLKNNDKRVAKILEPAFGTSIPDKIEKGLAQKLEQYVKNLYKDKKGTKDVVVTRDEFIRHLKGEFATHRNEIKAEALELQKKLEQQVQDAVQKAPEAGIARTELMQIIDERVRDAVANAGLEALAQGKITVNWQSQLRKEVNFLSRGRGTIIDAKHMSPVYKPQIKGKVSSPEWLDSTRRSPDVFPPARTLIRWDDEGDCWCGKESVSSKDGRPLGVFVGYLISNEIVPRYIVIEHILPTATLNPEAMPKDMDVWAYFTDLDVRNRVEDFSASHFPSEINNSWLEDGWVKIAQFEYQATEGMDGAHVHQFSPELGNIGAATDQIIVRAVSNHGSDHTCIYRVRLYGDEKKLTW